MSDNYGTPYFAFLTPSIVSYDTIGVWEVKVNGELIDGTGKDLITIINDLKTHMEFIVIQQYHPLV